MRAAAGIAALAAAAGLAACAVEVPPPSPPLGTLVVTEIAAEPEDGRPEWIELLNATESTVYMTNCLVRTVDGDNPVYLELTVEPGQRVVLADQADLALEAGALRADAVLQDLTLRHSGADEVLEVWCARQHSQSVLVASATYNWSAEGMRQGHSRQRIEGAEEEAWCEAPTRADLVYYEEEIPAGDDDDEPIRQVEYGTPGGPTLCDEPAGDGPTLPGQVLFTEIVVDVVEGAVPEWFELRASPANAGSVDLRGCQLEGAPHVGGTGTVRVHVLDPEQGETGIAPGERLLLAHANNTAAAADGFLVVDGTVPVDYFYSTLSFSNSELRSLRLLCPGPDGAVEIDRISFEWAFYDGDWDGYSLRVGDGAMPSDRLDSTVNDRPAAWCPADAADVYAEGELVEVVDDTDVTVPFLHRGTPGAPNGDCPVPEPWPEEGGVIFTEIMGNPAGSDTSEEWFELWNTTPQRVDLRGCRVVNDNLDTGAEDVWSVSDSLVLEGDARAVIATSENGDFWSCYDVPDANFDRISFNNSDHETLALICPDGLGGEVVVDLIDYDTNFTSGISLQVPLSLATAADNDDTHQWCSLPAGDPAYTFSCLDVETSETNYGTPGEASNCP